LNVEIQGIWPEKIYKNILIFVKYLAGESVTEATITNFKIVFLNCFNLFKANVDFYGIFLLIWVWNGPRTEFMHLF